MTGRPWLIGTARLGRRFVPGVVALTLAAVASVAALVLPAPRAGARPAELPWPLPAAAFPSQVPVDRAPASRAALPSPQLASRPADVPSFQVLTVGRAVSAGRIATHALVISNTSGVSETVGLSASAHRWAVTTPAFVVVPAGGLATAFVTVTIPAVVPARAVDTAVVIVRDARSGTERSSVLATRTGGDFDGRHYVGCRFDFDRNGFIEADDADMVARLESTVR
jgi:hypothetical protein